MDNLGRCLGCGCAFDQLSEERRGAACRLLILVCDDCFHSSAQRGAAEDTTASASASASNSNSNSNRAQVPVDEGSGRRFYCPQHAYLGETRAEVLRARLARLTEELAAEERAGPRRKQRRRTLRKQMAQVESRLQELHELTAKVEARVVVTEQEEAGQSSSREAPPPRR